MTTSTRLAETMTAPIQIVEAAAGPARRLWLHKHLRNLAEPTTRIFAISSDFDLGGPWAGINTLVSEVLPEIETQRPDLLAKHSFELVHVVPRLRRTLTVGNPTLTDMAADDEKVRNYAADRAFRIVHGLIGMLDSWKKPASPDVPWIIGCDAYDLGGPLVKYFFKELMRRRGNQLHIRLVATVAPGRGSETLAALGGAMHAAVKSVDLSDEPERTMDPAEALQQAIELAQRVGDDRIEMQVHLPESIKLWGLAGRPDKVMRCRYFGLAFYSKLGLYADSLRYGEGLLDLVKQHEPDNASLRWWVIIKLLNAYSGMSSVDSALALAEAALKETEHLPLAWGIHLYYMAAMLFARFKQPRDLTQGEQLLNRGLEVIQQSDIAEDERHFRAVFNRNGVAMIRSFQGRFQEAIELCRTGLTELNTYLSVDKHRLHRSILLYNIAQVYVATNSYTEAIHYFSSAMEMDPNYSEYYNERGNIFLRLGNLREALADYLKAIELSPPYFEVFTNLGQCYRRMGMMEEASNAYSMALDLEPSQPLALLGRAKAQEELGRRNAAIADYTSALALDPNQWDAYASRGVMYYENGEVQKALADLNSAIDLNKNMVDLYRNRAFVLAELGRHGAAICDLRAALLLNPSEDDRPALEAMLQTSEAAIAEQPTLKGA
ncbi:MAG TPA: tetratricopeptide repeat protein [Candidatus Angelobacter sp.]